MRGGAALAALAIAVSISTAAHAQPSRTHTSEPPVTRTTKNYAGSIIAVDAIAGGLALVGLMLVYRGFHELDSSESNEGDDNLGVGFAMMLASPLVYAFVPPLVHAQRGNGRGAGKSLALRVALPAAGAVIGAVGDGSTSVMLAGLGAVIAMVTDWAVFAKVKVTHRPTPFAAPVTGGGATLGLMGAF